MLIFVLQKSSEPNDFDGLVESVKQNAPAVEYVPELADKPTQTVTDGLVDTNEKVYETRKPSEAARTLDNGSEDQVKQNDAFVDSKKYYIYRTDQKTDKFSGQNFIEFGKGDNCVTTEIVEMASGKRSEISDGPASNSALRLGISPRDLSRRDDTQTSNGAFEEKLSLGGQRRDRKRKINSSGDSGGKKSNYRGINVKQRTSNPGKKKKKQKKK